jgi:hypothetical protein
MKYLAIFALLLIAGCTTTVVDDNSTNLSSQINSFEECVAAGNPVMESYPRQCRAGNRTFVSLLDLFDVSKNLSCETDDDCMLVNEELGFRCCWAGACEQLDYSQEKWIAVNKLWFEGRQDEYCPSDCGPAPLCAIQEINTNFTVECSQQCMKVPLPNENKTNEEPENLTNFTQTNITANQTPAPQKPEGMGFGGFYLVLDDIVLPRYDATCGAFSILYSNGTVADKLLICEGKSAYWTTPQGHKYRIFVVELAGGYTHAENWADVRIYG